METWLMFKQQLANWWFHFLLSILALDDYPNWGVDGTISITRWVWLWTRCCRVLPHAGYQVVGTCVKDFMGGKQVVMAELILGQLFFWGTVRNLWFCHEIEFVISDYSILLPWVHEMWIYSHNQRPKSLGFQEWPSQALGCPFAAGGGARAPGSGTRHTIMDDDAAFSIRSSHGLGPPSTIF